MKKKRPSSIQLGRLLQNSRDPVYLVNSRRRIIFFNRACEELTGVPAHRALKMECRWQGPEESFELAGLAGALCPPPEVLAGQIASVQSLLIHPDNKRSWHTIHFVPLSGEDGAVTAVLGRIMAADTEAPPPPAEPLRQTWARLRQRLWSRFGFDHIVAASHAMQRVLAQVRLASQNSATVLLRGEPGTGKESLARTIHYQSPNRERPFAALDCQGLPAIALQRHLSEEGLLGAAQQGVGVIYLREPTSLPRDLQARLDKQLAGPPFKGQPRIMAGSAASLEQACKDGLLLESLHCRLSTLVIDVPPLRERSQDLPLLAQQVLERCNADGEKQVHGIHTAALAVLAAHSWPGNLAEFDPVLCQAHARTQSAEIQVNDLPAKLRTDVELAALPGSTGERPLPLDELLTKVERRLIELALRQANGNLTKAAARLSIWRARLYRRMQFFGLIDTDKADDESAASEGGAATESGT